MVCGFIHAKEVIFFRKITIAGMQRCDRFDKNFVEIDLIMIITSLKQLVGFFYIYENIFGNFRKDQYNNYYVKS